MFELVQRLQRSILVESNIALEEERRRFGHVVLHVLASRDSKDVVKLFQRTLLGFWNPLWQLLAHAERMQA